MVFLYAKVLQKPSGDVGAVVQAKWPARFPVVLSHEEVSAIINSLPSPHDLIASLTCGADLRVSEAVRLRVKGPDLRRLVITVRDSKGAVQKPEQS